jgi:hypothetical protein
VSKANAQLTYQQLQVQYDSAWTFENLQLIPVKFKAQFIDGQNSATPLTDLISFQEALRSGKLIVKEVLFNGGADVDVLHVKNTGKQSVLVVSGELISGGKQDRIVAETMIIPPGKEEKFMSVFCAEKGRWDNKAKPFFYEGIADMALRKKMDILHRQTEIWKEIEQKFSNQHQKAATWPYVQLHKQLSVNDSMYLQYFMERFKKSDSSFAGFLAITGKRIIGCELFASSGFTQTHFKEMILGFIQSINKNDSIPSVSKKECEFFMDALLQNETSQKQFLQKHGKADYEHAKVFHLIAYGDEQN